MQLKSLALTALVIAVIWYWLKSRELKDLALIAARGYCRDLSLNLLDETVVLRSVRLQRNEYGGLSLRRRYGFDFTATGEERYQGEVILLGRRLESVKLPPHRMD